MNGYRMDMEPGHTSGRGQSALRLSVPFSGQSLPLRSIRSSKALVVEQFDRVAVDHTDHVTRDRPAMADPANQTMKRAVKRLHASKLVMPWRGNHDRGSVTREECDFRYRVAGVSPYPSWTGLKIPRQSIPA